MDENMFETHIGTAAHVGTKYQSGNSNRQPKNAKFLSSTVQQRTLRELGCEIVGGEKELSEREKRQEEERRKRYGRGCDLLKNMGWNIMNEDHRRPTWEREEEVPVRIHHRRLGLGYQDGHLQRVRSQVKTQVHNPFRNNISNLAECNYLGVVSEQQLSQAAVRGKKQDSRNKRPYRRMEAPARRTEIDLHTSGAINLLTATYEGAITSRCRRGPHGENLPEGSPKKLIARYHGLHQTALQRGKFAAIAEKCEYGAGGEGDRMRALGALGTCNSAIETQTTAEDFRQAGRRWRGGFPDEELIRRCHDDTHPSFQVTWRRVVRATGIGPGLEHTKLKEEVRRACDACLTCQKLQPARKRVAARIGSIKKRPFGEIAFDIIVLNTPDVDDNRYILTVIDNFSHAVELFAIKKASAEVITTCLHDVLCRWGKPHQVRCDNAKAFAALVTKQLLHRAKVKQNFCAPYSHNSNGQVENANRRVMDVLRAMILDNRLGANTHLQWGLLLPAVRRIIMARTILQYGCCPNDIAYMFSPENEASIFDEEPWMPPTQQEPAEEGNCEMINTLKRQHEILLDACERKLDEHLEKLAAFQEKTADDLQPLEPGDFVLVDMRERPHSKINSPWSGPWQVVEHDDNDATHPIVWLQHISSKKVERFNANMCKLCNLDMFEKVDEAIKFAAADNFEYEIEAVLDHRPRGERKRRRRDTYEFQVLWRDIERSEDNPSWEPYSNESLRTSEPMRAYCSRMEVMLELGSDFLPVEEQSDVAKKLKKAGPTTQGCAEQKLA
jgi:hypothetical protein